MCVTLHMPDGEEITTAGGLRARWPDVRIDPDYFIVPPPPTIGDDECICPFDLESAARLHGCVISPRGDGDFDCTPLGGDA